MKTARTKTARTRPTRGTGRTSALRPLAASLVIAVGATLAAPLPAAAQPSPPRPADVASLDGIMGAVYDVISGPAGQERDWDRFRSLFIDGARLIPTSPGEGGGWSHSVLSPDDFAAQSAPSLEANGFFEEEIHRRVDRYGPVAHVFSTYESRQSADDPEPFARGINSFQLLFDGTRWWVVTIFWHGETPDTPIPSRYLGEGPGL